MLMCDDVSVLNNILTLAQTFGLSVTDANAPIREIPCAKISIAVLKGAEDEIGGDVVERLRDGVEELYGFNSAILHGSARGGNSVATMQIYPH